MCELLVIRYKGCGHPDHLPGKLHEMPIYCANLEFVEAGISRTNDVCLMCRGGRGRVEDAKREAGSGSSSGAKDAEAGKEGEEKEKGKKDKGK